MMGKNSINHRERQLTSDEEYALAQRMRRARDIGDEDAYLAAQDEMIQRNLALVANIARRYAGGSRDLNDLMQVGTTGLMRAIELYDPDRGRLGKYASRWIRQCIQRWIRGDSTVHVPMSGWKDRARHVRMVSIYDGVPGTNDTKIIDTLASDGPDPSDEYGCERDKTQELINAALSTLTPRQEFIVRAGLEFVICAAPAREINITRDEKKEIRRSAIEHLRTHHGDTLRELIG